MVDFETKSSRSFKHVALLQQLRHQHIAFLYKYLASTVFPYSIHGCFKYNKLIDISSEIGR